MSRLARLGIVVAVAALVAAGCSSGDADGVASLNETTPTSVAPAPEVSAEEASLAFAQCMRDRGIADFEDPVVTGDGTIEFPLKAGEKTKGLYEEIFAVCEFHLEGTSFTANKTAEETVDAVDQLVTLSECMRDEGFDMPDPEADGSFPEVDKESSEFAAAWEACKALFEGTGK